MVDQGVGSVDLIYKNDEFGAGGREAYVAAFEEAGIDVGLDIQVQPDQTDQSAEVTQLAGGDADAIFVFMTEIETAAFLDEYQAQGLDKPLYGGDVLERGVDDRAGAAGCRRRNHHPCGAQRLGAGLRGWKEAYAEVHPDADPPDHNSIKGYTTVYIVKEATERIGEFDNSQFADTLYCADLTVEDEPRCCST